MTVAVALDLGTTTVKAGLLSQEGGLGGVVARPAPAIKGEGGRYESDALAYVAIAEEVLAACLRQTDVRPSLGLCSQRSSFLLWERASGEPVTPLISWQDDRGAACCALLREHEPFIRAHSGLPLTPYYLGPKLQVSLQQNPLWRERLLSGEWLLGTLDTFLIWRWSGGQLHVTDASMAARTQLMDVGSGRWSPELCALFGVPPPILPQILHSAGLDVPLENGLVLQSSMGDQSAALAASIIPGKAEALVNLGTGGFVVCYLPEGRDVPPGYLRTLAWQEAAGRMQLAGEGTLNSIAAALAGYPAAESRPEELGGDEIFCLAEPSGLGAPYFRSDLGVAFSEPVEHLAPRRIALLLQEGIVFRVARILEDFRREFGIRRVYLSGGLAALPCLQYGIALCTPLPAYRLLQSEAGLIGVASMAAEPGVVMGRQAERIRIDWPGSALQGKYVRWKRWLDEVLQGDPRPGMGRAEIRV